LHATKLEVYFTKGSCVLWFFKILCDEHILDLKLYMDGNVEVNLSIFRVNNTQDKLELYNSEDQHSRQSTKMACHCFKNTRRCLI